MSTAGACVASPPHRQLTRYHDALQNLPPSGGGGCHVALLGVANLGREAGVDPNQVAEDLATHVHGTRRIPNGEIQAAVRKAFTSTELPRARPPHCRINGPQLLNAIFERGAGFTEEALWEASPIRMDWPRERDAVEILRHLYRPDEQLFIGSRLDSDPSHIRTAREWIARFDRGCPTHEHIVPNPLSGKQGQTKDGKPSYRADSCVTAFRFVTVEFDTMPLDRQIQFWAGVQLPVAAVIHSGGKSLHGWVRADAANAEEWEREIEGKLFDILRALGADGACKNEARLSRIPGHFRGEKCDWQRILYLAPQGKAVQS